MGCVIGREASSGVINEEKSSRGGGNRKLDGAASGSRGEAVVEAQNGGKEEKGGGGGDGVQERQRGERRRLKGKAIPRLSNPPRHLRGEQVAAGWPPWLTAVCGEALNGWIPRKADTFEKIDKDETGVYKNLLQETAHRAGLNLPVYTTIRSGPGHVPNYSCTVEIAGMHFTGDPARTKKQAQKNAAMAAWSALRKLPRLHLSSSESKGNEEQEQVIIARVLASLHPCRSKNFSESDHHRYQNSSSTKVQPTLGMYPPQWQHCGISCFSPDLTLYQIWQQEQIMQQQNSLLALTIQPVIPSPPLIYPLVQSVLQPDHCHYFPPRELASVPVGPRFSIAASRPSFYFSNQIVPELNRGRSTVTIREIQEEKAEDPSVCNFSNETRVPTEDERQKHGSGSRRRNAELVGEQNGKSEWDSHRNIGSIHKPANIELQNSSNIDTSVPRGYLQASFNRSFRSRAVSSSMVRTMAPTSPPGSRPRHPEVPLAVASRLRTGVPRSPGMPTSERLGMSPTSLFTAPPVRIRSVVPVCSAPPGRSIAEVSKSKEKEDLKPEDKELSRTSSELGHLRL